MGFGKSVGVEAVNKATSYFKEGGTVPITVEVGSNTVKALETGVADLERVSDAAVKGLAGWGIVSSCISAIGDVAHGAGYWFAARKMEGCATKVVEGCSELGHGMTKVGQSVQEGSKTVSQAVVDASENFRAGCESLSEISKTPHVIDIGPNLAGAVKVTAASAVTGFGISRGIDVWQNRQQRMREESYMHAIGQLRESSCGHPKDVKAFKKLVDEALFLHPSLMRETRTEYKRCFDIKDY
jgi:hypothetical protein